MQLNRLEVKGFKSFGDKTIINFDTGITGIVGPNGCGKSNVVDAIRWVLGEQKTRNLRSEKMEDVIFNGSKSRKPHQMAEVSITFDNTRNVLPTEYAQVTVTRRYFRSGDSDYELNGVACRLKDIHDLFLDTGIGPDSYAIIELKMVEDILNDRDGSRRQLFEEAAGVSKFKIRKKQTLKKLDDTQANLDRVEDLLYEIEKNLKSLEKQAKQAQKYYELKESYKTLSITLAKIMMANFNLEVIALDRIATQHYDEKNNILAKISTSEAQIQQVKKNILEHEQILRESQKRLNDQMTLIRNHENEKKIKNERLNYLTDTQDRLIRQLQTDKDLKDKSETILKNIQNDAEKVLADAIAQEAKAASLKKEADEQKNIISGLQNTINELNTNLSKSQEEYYKLNKSLEINTFQLQTLTGELEKTHTDTHSQSTELAGFEDKLSQLEHNIAYKQQELDKISAAENENIEKIQITEAEIAQLRDKIADIGRKTDAKQNEYNLTKSLVENLEGFPEAVRFLKKNADWVKDVPLLSDILTCEEKYRITIENYLEPYMNYYIVQTEHDAIKAVNLLSNATMGKANFFILNKIEKNSTPNTSLPEGALHAMSLIEYEPKYETLIHYLLHNVYVVDNEENIQNHASDTTLISLSGKIIKRKYSISGGSIGLFEGKRIGRAKNIEMLEKEIKKLSENLTLHKTNYETLQNTLQSLKNNTQKAKLDVVQNEYNLLKQDLIAYQTRKEQIVNTLDKNSNRSDEIKLKIVQLQHDISEAQPRSLELNDKLTQLQQQLAAANAQMEVENPKYTKSSSIYNEQNIILYQLKNKLSSLQQDIEYRESNHKQTQERIEKSTIELQKIEADVKNIITGTENSDMELTAHYALKEKLEMQVYEAEKTFYTIRGEADNIEKNIKDLHKQRETCDVAWSEANGKLNECKIKQASLKERLSVEFNIDLENSPLSIESNEAASEDEHTIKSKIDQIKNAIEKIGPINPMAMETYNEINERYNLITTQKKDILDAKISLLQTISEIDTTAKENFTNTFNQIRQNFIKVFRSLFTEEDTCDLLLLDPSDPLESDIDIIAKPKGKKPQSINQLSGGEKTLTAISLLFGIYLIKPAPFCIFDEVDAPLDDANIDKFNNIIKKFSTGSQFIIVTHNKRTMSFTDIIYGVTMIEAGISRVVPVDLRAQVEAD
ncbi:MAG: chromosome segregation protein SMC [Cytophagales bacterium]|nr:chromosome segregation protein SMC [Cytophagales bacterium]